MEFEKAKELILNAQTICLVGHTKPDGDAIGSIGALYHLLTEMGKEAYMIIPDITPKFSFLPDIDKVVDRIPEDKEIDLLICLDCSEIVKRTVLTTDDVARAKKVLVIDHHKGVALEGDVKIIDSEAPANCEIIYRLIKFMFMDISKNVATYLYLGIMSDTGSFNYERTTGNTYRIAGDLVDHGIDFIGICKKLNDTYSETKMTLMSKLVVNMETYFCGSLRISVLDEEDITKTYATEDDAEGLVRYLRGIEGTVVAVYFRWTPGGVYKVSVRTEEPVDASKLAKEFGGGGHKRAAGFETTDPKETKEKLIQIVKGLL